MQIEEQQKQSTVLGLPYISPGILIADIETLKSWLTQDPGSNLELQGACCYGA